ncbi:MAG: hypothetical protein PHO00_00970 [bacterium]|nr:hypothetical protein [bacterium]
MQQRNYPIGIRGGILEKKHVAQIGGAIYTFMALLDRQTSLDGTVNFGNSIKLRELASLLGKSWRTIHREVSALAQYEYIEVKKNGNGVRIKILKPKKHFQGDKENPLYLPQFLDYLHEQFIENPVQAVNDLEIFSYLVDSLKTIADHYKNGNQSAAKKISDEIINTVNQPVDKHRSYDKSVIADMTKLSQQPVDNPEGYDKSVITKEPTYDKTVIGKEQGYDNSVTSDKNRPDKLVITDRRHRSSNSFRINNSCYSCSLVDNSCYGDLLLAIEKLCYLPYGSVMTKKDKALIKEGIQAFCAIMKNHGWCLQECDNPDFCIKYLGEAVSKAALKKVKYKGSYLKKVFEEIVRDRSDSLDAQYKREKKKAGEL